MNATIPGIHHVTAICGEPQRNVDFYAGVLGLRLVKKTVNFDDPGTYHLYYGDGVGTPGTILTFFAWVAQPLMQPVRGRAGHGQIAATTFSIPESSLSYWVDRLAELGADFDAPEPRFEETVLPFRDPDGLPLELVAHADVPAGQPWAGSSVPAEHALRAIRGVSLRLEGYERTASLLEDTLGFTFLGQEGNRFRFRAGEAPDTAAIDLLCAPDSAPGRIGIGVVHHVAWRAPIPEIQEQWRRVLAGAGYDPTPVLDRQYFRSVYFREPGGVIFEIATDPPGFTVDESASELGSALKLPPWLEPRRERIEARLPAVRPPRREAAPAAAPSAGEVE